MKNFDLKNTVESGQIFRWKYIERDNNISVVICHRDKVFKIYDNGKIEGENSKLINNFVRKKYELNHKHPFVKKALKGYDGLRMIKQDPWECLVSFIITQRNNIPRTRNILENLTKYCGKKLEHGFYSFPLPEDIPSEEELRKIGLGYRAKYIFKLKNIDLKWLYNLENEIYEKAEKELMKLYGVGHKVANCVLLFSLNFDEAFPEDVWIQRILKHHNLKREDFGDKAGIYQQYIFHYARKNKSLN